MKNYDNTDLGSGFFVTDEWVQFCSEVWQIKPQILVFEEEGKPYPKLESVIYRDKKNRIVNPPAHLYLGIRYSTTPTHDRIKLSRQWQKMLDFFTSFLSHEKGVWLALPPGVIDVRGLRWQNFATEVRYTYKLLLPDDLSNYDHEVRKKITKAQRNGYTCSMLGSEHVSHIYQILKETEQRQGFYNKLDARTLGKAFSIIGTDSFRCYGAWSPQKELVSVHIALYKKGLTAIGWVAGTTKSHLSSGVNQLLISYELADLATIGCTDFDFCGATMKHIGRAKESWGGVLTPFYTFRKKDLSYVIEIIQRVVPKLIKQKIKSIRALCVKREASDVNHLLTIK